MRQRVSIKSKVILFVFFSFFPALILAQYVQLDWSPNENPDISHYGIYRSPDLDSTFKLIGTVNHPDTTYLDEMIQRDSQYFYAATSIDIYGNESGFSNIVEVDVPASPVEFSSFSVSLKGNDAILEWSTASESNNYGFEVLRNSNIESEFRQIGFVNGNGTTANPQFYRFIDKDLDIGTYYYRLKQIDYDGEYDLSNIIQVTIGIPGEFRLHQNYPNPFNPSTTISYSLPKSSHTVLSIFNIKGQEIYRLVDEFQMAGDYSVEWEAVGLRGKKVPSGMYYYRLSSISGVLFRRMLVIK